MNLKGTIVAAMALLLAGGLEAKTVKVTVKKPGTLSTLIADNEKYNISSLKITGTLNGSDLRLLRDMAGCNQLEQPTAGQLKDVDLANVVFAKGGDFYIQKGTEGTFYPTSAYTIPKYLFHGCKIEQVTLPNRVDTIDIGAFELSQLRTVTLPDYAVVNSWAFNGDSLLEQVMFPGYLRELGVNCFKGCKSLKSITTGDVGYIPMNCFSDMPNLESCTIGGDMIHIDGDPFFNCPNLRTVTFSGNVMSTGGSSFAHNCPKLQTVTFEGNVMLCGFSNVEQCPLLKFCITKGSVIYGQKSDFIDTTNGKITPDVMKSLSATADKFFETDSTAHIMKFCGSNIYYNVACYQALSGNKQNALSELARAKYYGYDDYAHMKEDSDLITLHGDPQFEKLLQETRETGDKLYILKQAKPYDRTEKLDQPFTYEAATSADLVRLKEFFHLDSIAGNGDEISRIKNIMYWLHDQIPHDGMNGFPNNCPRNAIDLYKACKAQGRGLNCRGLAIVLSECYLAMGWPARFITCQPKAYETDPDCHVIDMVWSRTLNKWIWMDPTFAAYLTDENGLLLHPGEVRQRLIEGRPLVLNKDANWNHKNNESKEAYLNYMAKNLYFLSTYQWNGFEVEGSNHTNTNLTLSPKGTQFKWGTSIHNDAYFWQKPATEKL